MWLIIIRLSDTTCTINSVDTTIDGVAITTSGPIIATLSETDNDNYITSIPVPPDVLEGGVTSRPLDTSEDGVTSVPTVVSENGITSTLP